MEVKNNYITTSIAYVNAPPHIGFLLELLAADVIKRHAQTLGEKVFLLTGTDEHGIKVSQAAEAAGIQPEEYVDKVSKKFEALGRDFNIDFDYFIRTTNPDHVSFIKEKWQQLERAGALVKNSYRGLYCTGCEAFKTESEIKEGKCVIHETELQKVDEENWFLQIKDKKEKIRNWINDAVYPISRRQEVINVLDSGAYDEVSVSRPKEKYGWGIEVPNDPSQIMYVWVDALFNYISALKINHNENLWPADVQIIGKDILKFHAIIWPALLLATGYELPKKLLVHGFINVNGKKMSKSLGNVVTPQQLLDRYGSEGSRYLLLRQLSFYDDSNFTWDDFDRVYNGELANGLGNLIARYIGILAKSLIRHEAMVTIKPAIFPDFQFDLTAINKLINRADKAISTHKLWEDPKTKISLIKEVGLYLQEAIIRLRPYLPQTCVEIDRQLTELDSKPLFPRLKK